VRTFFLCREFCSGKVVRGRARVELSSKVLDVILGESGRSKAVKAAQGLNLRLLIIQNSATSEGTYIGKKGWGMGAGVPGAVPRPLPRPQRAADRQNSSATARTAAQRATSMYRAHLCLYLYSQRAAGALRACRATMSAGSRR